MEKCTIECHLCSKWFKKPILYQKHLQVHLIVNESYKCSICNFEFICESDYLQHIISDFHKLKVKEKRVYKSKVGVY